MIGRGLAIVALVASCTAGAAGAAGGADLVEVFECDEGFYYDAANDVCTRNACVCEHGTPVSTEACKTHQAHQCFDCNKGYGLNDDDHCVPEDTLPHVGAQGISY